MICFELFSPMILNEPTLNQLRSLLPSKHASGRSHNNPLRIKKLVNVSSDFGFHSFPQLQKMVYALSYINSIVDTYLVEIFNICTDT